MLKKVKFIQVPNAQRVFEGPSEPRASSMTVVAQVRPAEDVAIVRDLKRSPEVEQNGGKESCGLLHGVLNLQGIHPTLVPAIPSPEMFKESVHYPLVMTQNPFAKQVRAD